MILNPTPTLSRKAKRLVSPRLLMPARRHYLASYDVSDDKRRTRVFQTLEGVGDHLQYSVFLCELSRREYAQLKADLTPLIHQREDQLLLLDLGPAHVNLESAMQIIGRPHEPLVRTLIV